MGRRSLFLYRSILRRILPLVLLLLPFAGGCATIRVTDPPRTATEQFLISEAARLAIEQLSTDLLRDRRAFVDTGFLMPAWQASDDRSYMIAELRAQMLKAGVRLVNTRDEAEVVVEVRTAGLGIDRLEYLLGIPSVMLNSSSAGVGDAPVMSPELAIVKSTKQYGFASVSFVAYWRDTGELVYQSGPFVGRTRREDWWFFGYGPRTVGNIPTTEVDKAE